MRVQVLNVGQGSCTVIRTESGHVTVIDAGADVVPTDAAEPGHHRLDASDWLLANGITTVDLLVLSHLHRDHSQGFLRVADRLSVTAAVVPYARFDPPAPSDAWLSGYRPNDHVDSPHGQFQLVIEYLGLLDSLERQGTTIRYSSVVRGVEPSTVWAANGARLVQLYPTEADTLVTPPMVTRLATVAECELTGALDDLSENTNRDSAVFALLTDVPGTPAIIVGGDLSGVDDGEAWTAVLRRAELNGAVWILPHHGAPDGALPHHVEALQPLALIASVAAPLAAEYRSHWCSLEARQPASGVRTVVSTAAQQPGRAWTLAAGGITVTVGD